MKAGDEVLRLDVPVAEETQLRSSACDFWDEQLAAGPPLAGVALSSGCSHLFTQPQDCARREG